jgi:hypothetical protein
MSEITVEEQAVSRDTYIFQRSENVALMVMVIVITVSGVALAGVQLITSYRLALLGRDGAAGEPTASELRYDHGSVVVKSSVVGVLILAISFAFFMVFVIYVYTIREAGSPVTGIASAVRSGAAATSSFNLLSARPDTKSAPVQNKPVSATP